MHTKGIEHRPHIAVTLSGPSGVGPELAAKFPGSTETVSECNFVSDVPIFDIGLGTERVSNASFVALAPYPYDRFFIRASIEGMIVHGRFPAPIANPRMGTHVEYTAMHCE